MPLTSVLVPSVTVRAGSMAEPVYVWLPIVAMDRFETSLATILNVWF